MQVNGVRMSSFSASGYQTHGVKNSVQNSPSFGKTVIQVADDSYSGLVKDSVNSFMAYMRDLTNKAIKNEDGAREHLKELVGEETADVLIEDKEGYTERSDKLATKMLPASGQGTRGAEIRKMITKSLDIPETNKTSVPLPAVIGETADGEKLYLNTLNNELMHMMEAGLLSPFEDLEYIETEVSDGDATVIVEGLKDGIIPTDRPALFSYTDDVGTKGYKDYEELMYRYLDTSDSDTEVICRGFMEDKEKAAGVLGTFLPDGDRYKVFEKPDIETLNELLPDQDKVATNIGKTLFTPKGLEEIKSRIPEGGVNDPDNTLIKMDKGNPKWHVTEGILKPAGERGVLDVIDKEGQFSDIGNGTIFTDVMASIANGEFKNVFPEALEQQIRENIELAPDGLSATLNYGDKSVVLPTSKAE